MTLQICHCNRSVFLLSSKFGVECEGVYLMLLIWPIDMNRHYFFWFFINQIELQDGSVLQGRPKIRLPLFEVILLVKCCFF